MATFPLPIKVVLAFDLRLAFNGFAGCPCAVGWVVGVLASMNLVRWHSWTQQHTTTEVTQAPSGNVGGDGIGAQRIEKDARCQEAEQKV